MSRRGERGFTVIELLVCTILTAWLCAAALRGYALLRTGSDRIVTAAGYANAHRVTRTVLRAELGVGARGVDWHAHAPDSVRLRAFRSVAVGCAAPADSFVTVAPVSGRAIDPSKDSVLVLGADGVWTVAAVVARRGGATCVPPDAGPRSGRVSTPERWLLRPTPRSVVLLRVFETGSYHLSGRALRYRRGAGGRQPLTESVLDSARFVDSGSVLGAVLDLGPTGRARVVLARTP